MSARALRDVADVWGNEEPWPVDLTAFANRPAKAPNQFARLAAIPFAIVILVAVWLVPTVVIKGPVTDYLPSSDRLQGVITKTIPGLQTHRFRDDFRSGLSDWLAGRGLGAAAAGWTLEAGAIRPGRLRLWTRSMDMLDYQFEFEGQIEQRAMSWAFRAKDHANYYATKIAAAKLGSAASGRIVRLVMQNGTPVERVQLPSPIPIEERTAYRVRVSVKGNRFNTLVNDQLVDTWTDSRFRSGGVGFFTDQDEVASVRWATVTDRESFLDRLFATSFLVTPAWLADRH